MPRVFARYLRLIVAPWPLCADYSGVFPFGRTSATSAAAWLLPAVAFVSAVVVLWRRRQRLAAFGLAWFAVALAPVANIVPIPVPVAERFLYLPLAGMALAAAAGIAWLEPRVRGRTTTTLLAAGAAWLTVLAVLTWSRHGAWRDNFSLWSTTARDFPASWGAHHGLGNVLRERGDLDGAAREMERAAAMGPPRSARALIENDLGVVYGMQGRLAASEVTLERAIVDRAHAKAFLNLGITRLRRGNLKGGREVLDEAVRIDPYYARPLAILASLSRLDGDTATAADLLDRARRLDPRDPMVQAEMQALQGGRR